MLPCRTNDTPRLDGLCRLSSRPSSALSLRILPLNVLIVHHLWRPTFVESLETKLKCSKVLRTTVSSLMLLIKYELVSIPAATA